MCGVRCLNQDLQDYKYLLSVKLGFAIGIDTVGVLKIGRVLHILRFFGCLYRSTCRKHPSKNTYRFIFKLAFSFKKLSNFPLFFDDPVSLPSNGWEPWLETAPTGPDSSKSF